MFYVVRQHVNPKNHRNATRYVPPCVNLYITACFNYGEYAIIGVRWLLHFLQTPTPWISRANKNVLNDNNIRVIVIYFANKM